MKTLYALNANGKKIVTVAMDVPDFMPVAPHLNREWLRGIVSEEVNTIRKKPVQLRKRKSKLPRRARSQAKSTARALKLSSVAKHAAELEKSVRGGGQS
jgi:hypothetical protein